MQAVADLRFLEVTKKGVEPLEVGLLIAGKACVFVQAGC